MHIFFQVEKGLHQRDSKMGLKRGEKAEVELLVNPLKSLPPEPESDWNRDLPPAFLEDRLLLLALLPTDLGRPPVSDSRSNGLASARFSSLDRVDRSRA